MGAHGRVAKCPLSEVKRTCRLRCEMSASDPKRTSKRSFPSLDAQSLMPANRRPWT